MYAIFIMNLLLDIYLWHKVRVKSSPPVILDFIVSCNIVITIKTEQIQGILNNSAYIYWVSLQSAMMA